MNCTTGATVGVGLAVAVGSNVAVAVAVANGVVEGTAVLEAGMVGIAVAGSGEAAGVAENARLAVGLAAVKGAGVPTPVQAASRQPTVADHNHPAEAERTRRAAPRGSPANGLAQRLGQQHANQADHNSKVQQQITGRKPAEIKELQDKIKHDQQEDAA